MKHGVKHFSLGILLTALMTLSCQASQPAAESVLKKSPLETYCFNLGYTFLPNVYVEGVMTSSYEDAFYVTFSAKPKILYYMALQNHEQRFELYRQLIVALDGDYIVNACVNNHQNYFLGLERINPNNLKR